MKKQKYEIGNKRVYNSNYADYPQKVISWDAIDIKSDQVILFRIISTNSKYRQGVRLAIDFGEGYLEANGIRNKAFRLWEDNCPKELKIQCCSSEGKLSIYNVFDRGMQGGGERSLLAFCGMVLEEDGNIYRYHCNDSGFETNFDKLVFEIELL